MTTDLGVWTAEGCGAATGRRRLIIGGLHTEICQVGVADAETLASAQAEH
jgi:hypothetical protein